MKVPTKEEDSCTLHVSARLFGFHNTFRGKNISGRFLIFHFIALDLKSMKVIISLKVKNVSGSIEWNLTRVYLEHITDFK